MEESIHHYTDQYAYLCEIRIFNDDIVVFGSTPNLSFDFKKHEIKIRPGKYYDYVLSYAIKDEQLFLRSIEVRLSFLSKKVFPANTIYIFPAKSLYSSYVRSMFSTSKSLIPLAAGKGIMRCKNESAKKKAFS